MDAKADLRRAAREARRSRSAPDLHEAIAPLIHAGDLVASFVPLPDEPGVAPELGWLLPVLLPDGDLDWAAYDGRLVQAVGALEEPVGPRLGVEALAECDLVLVPALLVDRQGNRLGKGGGSYDRALARTTALTVALLHDDELVDEVPADPWDVPVRAAATPSRGVVRL